MSKKTMYGDRELEDCVAEQIQIGKTVESELVAFTKAFYQALFPDLQEPEDATDWFQRVMSEEK